MHVLQSQQWKWQLLQLQLCQDPIWRGGGDERVLGDGGVDVEGVAERVAGGVADGVAGGVAGGVFDVVVDGENLVVGESVLVQHGIQF